MDNPENHWHLDKRVPVALIGTIVSGFMVAGAWAANTDARLTSIEKQIEQQSDLSDRLIRVEEQNKNVLLTLNRIEARLEAKTDAK